METAALYKRLFLTIIINKQARVRSRAMRGIRADEAFYLGKYNMKCFLYQVDPSNLRRIFYLDSKKEEYKLWNWESVMMRKIAFFLCFVLCFGLVGQLSPVEAAYMPPKDMTVYSQAVYLYNLDTDTPVYEKNSQTQLQPASTAKIMTAILALENTDDLDETFTYPTYIFDMLEPGVSQADVRIGEEMTMRKALYCLMLQSDCYSALAIADRIGGGDIQTFVDMMNAKAQELGAVNTVFTNPHGLYDENMHTTAYDLFLISKYAMKLDGFMDIASTVTIDIGPTNIHSEGYNLYTTIKPMMKSSEYYYEPIQGIKTGTLEEVGYNYVSTASKNGYSYLLVLMGAPMFGEGVNEEGEPEKLEQNLAFVDAKNIYEWAFNSFETKLLLEKNKTCNSIPVRLSSEADTVNLVSADSFSALVPIDMQVSEDGDPSGTSIVLRYNKKDYVDAPVKRGQKLGTVDLVLNNEVLGTIDLLAEKDVSRSQMLFILDYIKNLFSAFWIKFVVILLVLILAFYIVLMILRNRYRKRYRRARGRRR